MNQLDDATISDIWVFQKQVNDILKKCDLHLGGDRMRVTITTILLGQDPKDKEGNSIAPNGTVPDRNARTELKKHAMGKEIKNVVTRSALQSS